MNNYRIKIITTILITIIVAIYYIIYFVILITLIDGIWKYLLGIIPLLLLIQTIKVCIERIKEIKGGEEDDISKY